MGLSFARVIAATAGILLTGGGLAAQAQTDDRPLVYAGFAFAGNSANQDYLYPYTAALIAKNKTLINDVMVAKLRARPDLLKRLSLEKAKTGTDVTSVACALVQENVEIQQINNKYMVVALLQANVLGFNRESKTIVASYPLRMRITRTRDKEPTPADIQAIILEAYTSTTAADNLIDHWLTKLENARFKYGGTKYLRITDITVTSEAEAVLKEAGVNLKAFENKTANLLEGELADKAGVPIVPNSEGEVGAQMSLRFDNAESLMLQLPEADYGIKFLVRGFATTTTEGPGSITDIYRTKGTLTVSLPVTGKVYMDEQVYDTQFVRYAKGSGILFNKWEQFNKSLQNLMSELSRQLVNPDDEWLKDHAARKVEAKPAFLKVKQIFQEL